MKTLINCTIITMDDSNPFFANGMIVINNNTIDYVGEMNEKLIQGETINLDGKIVLPGFINTHTHTHSPLFRGMADDLYLMDWLNNYIWPAEKHMTFDDAYNATILSCLELTESGVTTYADQFYYSEAIAKAAEASGLRAFIAATVFSGSNAETDSPIEKAKQFLQKYKNDPVDRIYPCIGPHAIYSCSTETLKEVIELAKEDDLIIHIHIAETETEFNDSIKQHGMTPTKYLESIGMFDCKTLSAHSIHLSEDDKRIFSKYKVKASYNPVSNLKLCSGYMDYVGLKELDVDISLALDGVQSNNSFDILSDLKTGILIQKMKEDDPTLLNAYEALKLITINAAKCLWMDHQIGSLEVGKYADIVCFDKTHANMNPVHNDSFSNVVSAIVYAANSKNVSDVLVDGEFVYKDREHLKLNPEEAKRNVTESSRRILDRIGYFR